MSENIEKEAGGAIVGQIYTGKVLKIKPFGAIVSLPNSVPGLVHISQIANGFIQSVGDILNIGDEVDVRVVSNDTDSGKISLSMKDVPQRFAYGDDDEDEDGDEGSYYYEAPVITAAAAASFEEKFKTWQKTSNERIAGINRRNKRNKRR
jgi:general stress protein 13/S1 RNA binding domain protein